MGAIDAPFIPLVPRRIVTSADQPDTALPLPPADAADDLDALHPSSTDDVTPTAGKSSPSPPREDLVSNTSGSAETAETARAPVDAGARLEDEAVRIAGLACARALGRALDIDAEIVRIFVRDAIEAAGESGVEVRLNPVDAEACIDENARVLADSALGRGTVVASGAMGSVFASLHDRSLLLARWAAGEK